MRLDLRLRPGVTRADLRRRAAGSAAQLIARIPKIVVKVD